MMANKVSINFRGFASVPGKYVDIVSEEFDQCLLFMGRQLCLNLKKFLWINVNYHFFQIFAARPLGWHFP